MKLYNAGSHCWAEPLSPARHILAEEARREQTRLHEADMVASGAMGMPVPEEKLPPESQEINRQCFMGRRPHNGGRMLG